MIELSRGCVVRVVRGRKVPIGTVARVFWYGESRYGTRLGIKVEGSEEALWTAATNVEVIEAAPARAAYVAPAGPAVASLRGLRICVERGRNVAHGTAGIVFWEGAGTYGKRIGFKCERTGETCWTSASNVVLAPLAAERAMVLAAPPAPTWHEAEVVAPFTQAEVEEGIEMATEMIQKPLVWE